MMPIKLIPMARYRKDDYKQDVSSRHMASIKVLEKLGMKKINVQNGMINWELKKRK